MIPVLLVVTFIIFFSLHLIPGDPAVNMLGDKAANDSIAVANMRARLGLDQPLLVQYGIFLKGLVTLDLGNSIFMHKPVLEIYQERFVVTATYVIITAFFTTLISLPLGYLAGIWQHKPIGKVIASACLILLSLPEFWVGILLLFFLALKTAVFPVGGWGPDWPMHIKSLILPALAGCVSSVAMMVRNIQSGIISVLRKDYVDFARAKGTPESIIAWRYILKNVMISSSTLLAMRIASMLGSSVVIETVFALPGVGQLLVNGVLTRDYPIVECTVLLFATMVLFITLITDVCYSLLDPRVKLK
jgi:peptide/nickel transport system permease protein